MFDLQHALTYLKDKREVVYLFNTDSAIRYLYRKENLQLQTLYTRF